VQVALPGHPQGVVVTEVPIEYQGDFRERLSYVRVSMPRYPLCM
jgi:hypothetical protein